MWRADNIVKTGITHNKSKLAKKWLVYSAQSRYHLWLLTFKFGLHCPYSRISLEYKISGKQFHRVVGIFLQTTKRIGYRPRVGDIIIFYLSFTLL